MPTSIPLPQTHAQCAPGDIISPGSAWFRVAGEFRKDYHFKMRVFVKTSFYHLHAELLHLILHDVFSWIAGFRICNVTCELGGRS